MCAAERDGESRGWEAYSFYQGEFYNTTAKTVDAFIVEHAIPPDIDYSVGLVSFVNVIVNANPMTMLANSTTTAMRFRSALKSRTREEAD